MAKEEFDDTWAQELRAHVAHRPIVILKLEDRELQGLKETRDGVRQFSLTRAHEKASGLPAPCICLFFAEKSQPFGNQKDPPAAYVAIFKSKGAATTFDSRLTLRRGVEIQPSTPSGIVDLFKGEKFEQDIRKRLDKDESIVRLGPKESMRLIDKLLDIETTPYVAQDLPDLTLATVNVTTVKPERTFWGKIIILHGLRQWRDRRGELRHGGQRVSRHYYDVHQLMKAASAVEWQADHALAVDCAHHARLFFGNTDLGLDTAEPGPYTLSPTPAMRDALAKDYEAMTGMIFGDAPSLESVLASVESLNNIVNNASPEAPLGTRT